MAQTSHTQEVGVALESLYRVIVDYTHYPEFVSGCSSARVLENRDSVTQVSYAIKLFKEISYVLEHKEDRQNKTMTWRLISSDFLTQNTGSWRLVALSPEQTKIQYEIDIAFKVSVPNWVLSRLVKSSLPTMIENFVERARQLGL